MSTERILRQIDQQADVARDREQLELRSAAAELARTERARIPLADRFRAAHGRMVRIHCEGGAVVEGVVNDIGAQWCEISAEPRGAAVIPLRRIGMISGLGERSRESEGPLRGARTLASRLRELADERALLECTTIAGTARGRILGVGQDALDLMPVDDQWEARGRRVTIPLDALVLIRRC